MNLFASSIMQLHAQSHDMLFRFIDFCSRLSVQVVPDKDSDRCKVVIEGCATDVPYKVAVAAIPKS